MIHGHKITIHGPGLKLADYQPRSWILAAGEPYLIMSRTITVGSPNIELNGILLEGDEIPVYLDFYDEPREPAVIDMASLITAGWVPPAPRLLEVTRLIAAELASEH